MQRATLHRGNEYVLDNEDLPLGCTNGVSRYHGVRIEPDYVEGNRKLMTDEIQINHQMKSHQNDYGRDQSLSCISARSRFCAGLAATCNFWDSERAHCLNCEYVSMDSDRCVTHLQRPARLVSA